MSYLPVAYEGQEPYIFISYAHKNSDRVMPIIAALQSRGFRVWYDAGIEAGTEWPEYIADHLAECGCFAAMITKEALESHNCRREINYAIEEKVPMLVVYLEDVEMTRGMKMQLGTLQAVLYNRYPSLDSFVDILCESELLQPCKGIGTVQRAATFGKAPTARELFAQGRAKEVEKDYVAAVKLYRRAAEQGSADAQTSLGILHYRGLGTAKDDREAVRWWSLAAQQGNRSAQYNLGLCYRNGAGVEVDEREAARLWLLAAQQGLMKAQLTFAACCQYGRGTRYDPQKARYWFKLAAEQGSAEAQYQLGLLLELAIGGSRNGEEAARLYRLAANQGHRESQYRLGLCYKRGFGIGKDLAQARFWVQKSADQGYLHAQKELRAL